MQPALQNAATWKCLLFILIVGRAQNLAGNICSKHRRLSCSMEAVAARHMSAVTLMRFFIFKPLWGQKARVAHKPSKITAFRREWWQPLRKAARVSTTS
jgi:hypothetical protein